MVEFKLTIADSKTGRCMQKTVAEKAAEGFIGLKIGDAVKGEVIDLAGYEFLITGGSDFCGFPMRKGISGTRKRILIERGVGFRGGRKGMRKRKTVCGEVIHDKMSQINLKITKHGAKKLEMPKKEGEEKKEEAAKKEVKPEKKEAKPKEEVKKREEAKKEEIAKPEKKEEKKEAKPKEGAEKKEEVKEEKEKETPKEAEKEKK